MVIRVQIVAPVSVFRGEGAAMGQTEQTMVQYDGAGLRITTRYRLDARAMYW